MEIGLKGPFPLCDSMKASSASPVDSFETGVVVRGCTQGKRRGGVWASRYSLSSAPGHMHVYAEQNGGRGEIGEISSIREAWIITVSTLPPYDFPLLSLVAFPKGAHLTAHLLMGYMITMSIIFLCYLHMKQVCLYSRKKMN